MVMMMVTVVDRQTHNSFDLRMPGVSSSTEIPRGAGTKAGNSQISDPRPGIDRDGETANSYRKTDLRVSGRFPHPRAIAEVNLFHHLFASVPRAQRFCEASPAGLHQAAVPVMPRFRPI
jgi:hypothetical protein